MEVMPPSSSSASPVDMNIDSNSSTPFLSASSSPQRTFNLFFSSAPTSPRRSSFMFFNGGPDDEVDHFSTSAVVPFNWEFEPGVPKPSDDDSFEFDFSGQLDMMLEPSLSSADELFSGGKIRPLNPPPAAVSAADSAKVRGALSPKRGRKNYNNDVEEDPFETAIKISSKPESNRGRSSETPHNLRSNSRKKGMSRSLSPLRVSEFAQSEPNGRSNNGGNGSSSKRGSKKWRLKDLFLFRSASEGRAATTGKDPLRKYFKLSNAAKKIEESGNCSKNCESFRSVASSSCSSMADVGSMSRRRGGGGQVERHYTANRAVAEEMKKKTSLPYKHGLLGCIGLGFFMNPAFQDISKVV